MTSSVFPKPKSLEEASMTLNQCKKLFVVLLLLLTNPSDLNQIRSMRSFALITSNTKSGRLSRSAFRNNRRTKHGQEENEQLQLVPSTLSTRR
ncbi:hypothetical protein AVEN_77069-1 [Araneus ventricosus]|uniref:Uncharacterized protein n=1 Tax=Araneus ventricosus TaxID=182803 RepID=A0A4Y2G945_ARAVE|nr:hypothetical protein AVEN_77069-1 [Araneus ventricosus]